MQIIAFGKVAWVFHINIQKLIAGPRKEICTDIILLTFQGIVHEKAYFFSGETLTAVLTSTLPQRLFFTIISLKWKYSRMISWSPRFTSNDEDSLSQRKVMAFVGKAYTETFALYQMHAHL